MYWDSTHSNTLDVSKVGNYVNYEHMSPTVPEGYNCDPLQPTTVLFMGSCDLDGPINDTRQSWARLLHSHLDSTTGNIPYIALGKMTAGFMSFPRRLNAFCEKYGAPQKLYMVVPRPVAIEIPLYNGSIVSVSNRIGFPNYLLKHGEISNEDHALLSNASQFCQSQLHNEYYQLYQFEETTAFLKLLCKHYNIELKWTLNLSASAIAYYQKYFSTFINSCPYMAETFAGIALAKDFSFDGSMGNLSQHQIFKLFQNPSNDIGQALEILELNLSTAEKLTTSVQRSL